MLKPTLVCLARVGEVKPFRGCDFQSLLKTSEVS